MPPTRVSSSPSPRPPTPRARALVGALYLRSAYPGGHLYAHRSTPPDSVGAVVLFGGFDSYMEELFATQHYFVGMGYDVVVFEGPAQGAVLEEDHLPLTPHWGAVVSAVIDHYGLNDITLLGLGAPSTASPREQCATPRWPTGGCAHRMHTTGATTPYDFLCDTARYETASVSGRLTQDVLLLAGSQDRYVPRGQLAEQLGPPLARCLLLEVWMTLAAEGQRPSRIPSGVAGRVIAPSRRTPGTPLTSTNRSFTASTSVHLVLGRS